eukprot:6474071-Alexandrium_andersonii.AAC.1
MLRPLWRSGLIPVKQKIRVYEACVLTRMLYCIGATVPTPTQVAALESRHVSFLRRILKIPTTWGAKKTGAEPVKNTEVLRRAGQPTISSRIAEQQILALGHLLRAGHQAPQCQVTFDRYFGPRVLHGRRRPGVPRVK